MDAISSDLTSQVTNTPSGPTGTQESTSGLGPVIPGQDRNRFWEEFRSRIDICKLYRKKHVANWTVNIDYRRGKPFTSQTDEDRIAVNLDWSMTKAKHAALFSQVPRVHIDHPPQTPQAGEWLVALENKVNDTLLQAGIEAAMDECLPDCINAAGFGVVLVTREAITENVQVPDYSSVPPWVLPVVQQSGKMPDGSPVPTMTVPRVLDSRYVVQRISPADLLWPINLTSDLGNVDNSPWIGRTGRMSWAQAVLVFGLTEADKDAVLGEDRTHLDRLTHDVDKDKVQADEMVGFDEVFYKDFQYDPSTKSYNSIHHLVFVHGRNKPVIDEPWKGQRIDPQSGDIQGATKFPIRVLTLAYITDEAFPPSDSAIIRPQVNEINKGRTMMILQRERSLPIRTADVNRIDPVVLQSMMRGTWQAIIPVQGNAEHIITEVSRAQMPVENFKFDEVAKNDLQEATGMGSNQLGDYNQGRRSAAEANIIQTNNSTRIGRERAKVGKLFTSIAEVLAGLIIISEPPESFGQGFNPVVSKTLSYSILADSTVLLDSNQRIQRLVQFLNFTVKSGFINVEPVLREIAQLSGLDPNVVVVKPQPKPPVEPSISLRFTGVEDLLNPLVLAFMLKSGQAPPPELIEQAKQLIQQAVITPPIGPYGHPVGMPEPPEQGGPAGPPQEGGPQGQPPVQAGPPQPIPQPQPQLPHPQMQVPQPPPPPVGSAHPNWEMMSRLNKREGPGGGSGQEGGGL